MSLHPFVWIREPSRKIMFWTFAALAVLTMVALQLLGGPLKTNASPAGIVSFELAGSSENIERILASWDPSARVFAGLNLGLDFLFIDAYVGVIGLGCVLVGSAFGRRVRWLGAAGGAIAWAVVLAGVLDCVENYALIRLLLGSREALLPTVARWCAVPKFLIVLAGLLYIALGAALSLLATRRDLPQVGA
jgi:hypothetical protein